MKQSHVINQIFLKRQKLTYRSDFHLRKSAQILFSQSLANNVESVLQSKVLNSNGII